MVLPTMALPSIRYVAVPFRWVHPSRFFPLKSSFQPSPASAKTGFGIRAQRMNGSSFFHDIVSYLRTKTIHPIATDKHHQILIKNDSRFVMLASIIDLLASCQTAIWRPWSGELVYAYLGSGALGVQVRPLSPVFYFKQNQDHGRTERKTAALGLDNDQIIVIESRHFHQEQTRLAWKGCQGFLEGKGSEIGGDALDKVKGFFNLKSNHPLLSNRATWSLSKRARETSPVRHRISPQE